MKIFLTGASGMLAAEVVPKLIELGHTVYATDLQPRHKNIIPLDITQRSEVIDKVIKFNPDYVFHLAAETNVDLCEQKHEHAYLINTEGTRHIVSACNESRSRLLYISTGSVFYGDKKEPYIEEDQPRPKNIYAESKWRGEEIVKSELKEYFIVRAGWMIGGWEIDKKFVYKIVQQLMGGKTQLRVVSDKFGSPTFTSDFASNLMNIIETDQFGLYHLANKGAGSRYDIAVKIVEYMGLTDTVRVEAINSDEFPLPAPRPDSEMIKNARLEALGLNQMPHWEESLKNYIESNKTVST